MDVCIIGCGNQGGCFGALLAMEEEVGRVVLADMDVEQARHVKQLIHEIGGKASQTIVETASVNAMDPKDVAKVAENCNFIFNGILPFCNLAVMQGALLAGAHYMDLYALSSDLEGTRYEETVEAQMELDQKFKDAGLTAFLSQGVSPGWVNLASKYITDQMDEVDEIGVRSITWLEATDIVAMGPPVLSMEMTLHLEPPSYYKDGVIVPLDDELAFAEEFQFPKPAGTKKIFMESVSCVEALIQKFTDKPVHRIYHRGGIFSGTSDIKDVIFQAVRKQVLEHPQREMLNLKEALASSLKPMANVDYKAMVESGELINGADTAAVIVYGKKKGQKVRHEMTFNSTLHEAIKHLSWAGNGAYSTVGSLPIILAGMLMRGEFTRTGVIAPGLLEEPEMIFRKLEERGHILGEKMERYTCMDVQ